MPKGKRTGKSFKEQYTAYKTNGRQTKNKIAQLEKVCKLQPNNEDAKKALDKVNNRGRPHMSGRRSNGHICKGTPFTILEPQTGKEVVHRTNNYIKFPVVRGLQPKSAAQQLVELGLAKPRRVRAKRNKKPARQSV